MKRYRVLVKAFLKNNSMDESNDRGRKIKNVVLSIFAIFFIFIPVVVISGLFTYLMTKSLIDAGHAAFGVQLMFGLISIFIVIFGINVVFNELYFSTDIERILPFPLRPMEITASKFTAVLIGENIMTAILVFSCMVGFGLAVKMNILQWILALICGFFLPVAPTAACAIIGIILMSFTPIIKSKEAVRRISMVIMLIIFALMAMALLSLDNVDIENFILNIATSDIAFVKVLKVIFPQVTMLADFMATGNIMSFIGFVLVNVAFVAVFLLISEVCYMKSITGLREGASGNVKQVDIHKNTAVKSPAKSLFSKEMRILVRTPVFFTNCIAITFVWPVFVYLAGKIMNFDYVRNGNLVRYDAVVLVFSVSIVLIMASMNSLGSNAFSREGEGIYFMKYIPVDYKTQWNVKARISLIWSMLGTIPFMLGFAIYVGLPVLHIIVMVPLMAAVAWFVTYLGMLLDSINPKLVWEDALSALRENYNTFFCMAICMTVGAAFGVGAYFMAMLMPFGAVGTGAIELVIFVIADIILYRRCMTKGIENLKEVGEI